MGSPYDTFIPNHAAQRFSRPQRTISTGRLMVLCLFLALLGTLAGCLIGAMLML